MKFGVFDHLDRGALPLGEHYENRLKLIEAYDRLGIRSYHLAEHHATPLGMAPSPGVFLAAVAQRTRRLRFGPLVYTLSLHHPLRIVEEICMLDQMSGGRLELGVGRGISPYEVAYYGVDPAKAQPMYIEALSIILSALAAKTVNFSGEMQRNGLPFGVTLAAPAFADEALCRLGDIVHRSAAVPMGATQTELPPAAQQTPSLAGMIRVAVCGAHMSGLPLNMQLTERGGRLLRRCRTAPRYRLFALEAFSPPRPGLLRSDTGQAIDVEVWAVPSENFGSFVDGIPSPLGIGTLELEDGESLRGFLCESYAVMGAPDITGLGGWRQYLAQRRST